jgi:hypothetical protein
MASLREGYKEPELVLNTFTTLTELLQAKSRKKDASLLSPVENNGGWDILLSAIQSHEDKENIQRAGARVVEILVEAGGGKNVCKKLLEWLAKVICQHRMEDDLIVPLVGAVHGLCWKESGALTASQLNTTSILVSSLSTVQFSSSFRALSLIVRHGPSMDSHLELEATRSAQRALLLCFGNETFDERKTELAESACALLWELSSGDEGARRRLVDQGALDTIWQVLQNPANDEYSRIQELCWRIVRNLHPLIRPDTADSPMSARNSTECKTTIRHLECMQLNFYDSLRRLIRMMKLHESAQSSGLQEMHCWALQEILRSQRSEMDRKTHNDKCSCLSCDVVRLGVFERLVEVMERYERCTGIQRFAFVSLGLLCKGHTRNVTILTRRLGTDLQRIIRSMTVNLRCAAVQQEACTALCCMFRACFEFKSWPEAMQSEQALKAVLQTLRFHIADAVCAETACALLKDMAWVPTHRTAFARLDGVEVVVKAMTCHITSVVLQREGCGILHALSWNPDNKEQIVGIHDGNRGLTAIIAAMCEHREDTEIQREGCSALSILSYSVDANKAAIQERGGISSIVRVLLNPLHIKEEQLVERACLALWSLASMTPPPKGQEPDPASIAMVRPREASVWECRPAARLVALMATRLLVLGSVPWLHLGCSVPGISCTACRARHPTHALCRLQAVYTQRSVCLES